MAKRLVPKHIVICVECGKQFDASWGGYYDKSTRRYTCKSCAKKIKKGERQAQKEQEADVREATTGMRQSSGAMIAKIAFGVLFIISAFQTGSVGSTLVGLVIGVALIAWGALPAYSAKRSAQAAEAEALRATEEEANKPKRCSACGAVTKGNYCEYCGSPLD